MARHLSNPRQFSSPRCHLQRPAARQWCIAFFLIIGRELGSLNLANTATAGDASLAGLPIVFRSITFARKAYWVTTQAKT